MILFGLLGIINRCEFVTEFDFTKLNYLDLKAVRDETSVEG